MSSFHFLVDGQKAGPVSEEDLQALFAAGRITRATLIWRAGMPQWQPLQSVLILPAEPITDPADQVGQVCGFLSMLFAAIGVWAFGLILGSVGLALGIVSLSLARNKLYGAIGTAASVLVIIGTLIALSVNHY